MASTANEILLTASKDKDEADVLRTVQEFIGCIAEGDKASMLTSILPDGGATLHRPPHIMHMNLEAAVNRIPLDGSMGQLEQRIHDTRVMVADEIAMVWMPNEFYVNGKIAHEGISITSLLKVDGKWLISGSVDSCIKMVTSEVNHPTEHKHIH